MIELDAKDLQIYTDQQYFIVFDALQNNLPRISLDYAFNKFYNTLETSSLEKRIGKKRRFRKWLKK